MHETCLIIIHDPGMRPGLVLAMRKRGRKNISTSLKAGGGGGGGHKKKSQPV